MTVGALDLYMVRYKRRHKAFVHARERSRGKQHRGLCKKAVMQGLGVRPDCQHKFFVRTERKASKIKFIEKT